MAGRGGGADAGREGKRQGELLTSYFRHRLFPAVVQEPRFCLWPNGVEAFLCKAWARPLGVVELDKHYFYHLL